MELTYFAIRNFGFGGWHEAIVRLTAGLEMVTLSVDEMSECDR